MNTRLHQVQSWPELARQAKWSAATMAKNRGVSLRTLERYFLKEMGILPKAWLSEQRQQRANELIQGGFSVKETAAQLDYKHPSHLTNGFKKQWGCCPTNMTAPMRAQKLLNVAFLQTLSRFRR
jgi:AraC-like DNA-binding protein